jgi:hypothetical protein
MGVVNLPPNLYGMFNEIQNRLTKLENAGRFTLPNVATDPTAPRNGDLWLNTTSNIPKYVDNVGAVTTLGGSSGGSPFGPRVLKTGYSYGPNIPATSATSTLPVNNTLYAMPIYIPAAITATSLSMNINALAGTSGGYGFALYSNSSTDDYPNAKLADAFIDTSTTFGASGWNASVISVSLSAGLYWLAAVRQAATAPTMLCLTAGNTGDTAMPWSTTASPGTVGAICWTQAGVTGTLPATFTATKTFQSGTIPLVLLGV